MIHIYLGVILHLHIKEGFGVSIKQVGASELVRNYPISKRKVDMPRDYETPN